MLAWQEFIYLNLSSFAGAIRNYFKAKSSTQISIQQVEYQVHTIVLKLQLKNSTPMPQIVLSRR